MLASVACSRVDGSIRIRANDAASKGAARSSTRGPLDVRAGSVCVSNCTSALTHLLAVCHCGFARLRCGCDRTTEFAHSIAAASPTPALLIESTRTYVHLSIPIPTHTHAPSTHRRSIVLLQFGTLLNPPQTTPSCLRRSQQPANQPQPSTHQQQ